MAAARIGALLTVAMLFAACFDAAGERTRRDLEEIGWADLGEVRAYIDPGVALVADASRPFVRFRANAPDVTIAFSNAAQTERIVKVELANAFQASSISVPSTPLGRTGHAFLVPVPPRGEFAVTVRAPGGATAAPFRFAWVGDVQGGNERFARIRARINADSSFDFVLFGGDVTQRGTQEQVDAFVAQANQLVVPWYSLLGNHEAIFGEPIAFQRTIGRINTRFDYKGARFLLLDSASATLDEWTYGFVERAMAPDAIRTRIVGMHVPPLDPEGLRDGGFSDRGEAARLLARLSAGGTDLILAGHLHTLRLTSQAGIPTWVSGNGGVERSTRFDGTDLHYLAVTVDPIEDAVRVEPVLVP